MTDSAPNRGDFTFMQLADPQLGMFAKISDRSPEDVAAMRTRFSRMPYHGVDIRPVRPITGFAPETANR